MLAASVGGAAIGASASKKTPEPDVTISQEVSDVSEIKENEDADNNTVNIVIHSALCSGEMQDDSRQYDRETIYKDGILEFYSKDSSYQYDFLKDDFYRVETKTVRGQFDLQSKCEEGHYDMKLQTGVKFNELGAGRGDYIMADENGVLTVYDSNDKVVGNVQSRVYEEKKSVPEDLGGVAGFILGGVAGGIGANVLLEAANTIEDEKKKKNNI